MKILFLKSLRPVRKLIMALIGFSVLLVGVAMIVLPGPAFIVIPAGLIILGTEFVWAKKLLAAAKNKFQKRRT